MKELWDGKGTLSLPGCKMDRLKMLSQLYEALKVYEALGDKAVQLFLSIYSYISARYN